MALYEDTSNNRMLVAITRLDFDTRMWVGWNNLSGEVAIFPRLLPGGTYVIPKVGEQWLIQKLGQTWYLDDKTDFQDPRVLLPPEEGLTAIGGSGPTYIVGERVELPSELYIGGVKYAPGGTGGNTAPAPVQLWDQEMVLNAGALASGYNDLAGGIIVNAPDGVAIDSILFRLGGDPAATVGGSGGISITFWRGTTTNPEVTQIGGIAGMSAHDSILTLTTPFKAVHNSVLRAKIALGSATVAVSCHVQWRGRRL